MVQVQSCKFVQACLIHLAEYEASAASELHQQVCFFPVCEKPGFCQITCLLQMLLEANESIDAGSCNSICAFKKEQEMLKKQRQKVSWWQLVAFHFISLCNNIIISFFCNQFSRNERNRNTELNYTFCYQIIITIIMIIN